MYTQKKLIYLPRLQLSGYSVITMSKSKENLAAAFAGESQANRKYLAFAKKAEEEGYPQIGKLFKAAAAAETVIDGDGKMSLGSAMHGA